jgi:hypothetical protein
MIACLVFDALRTDEGRRKPAEHASRGQSEPEADQRERVIGALKPIVSVLLLFSIETHRVDDGCTNPNPTRK